MTKQSIGAAALAVALVMAGQVAAHAQTAAEKQRIDQTLAKMAAELKQESVRIAEKLRVEIKAAEKLRPEMKALTDLAVKMRVGASTLVAAQQPQLAEMNARLAAAAARLRADVASQSSALAGFSVVLVQGDLKGSGTTDGLPAAAAKALADLKDFLPYKSYQLLDSQWTLGSNRVISRLQGAGQTYELTLSAPSIAASGVSVSRFLLRAQPTTISPVAQSALPADAAREAEARRVAEERVVEQRVRVVEHQRLIAEVAAAQDGRRPDVGPEKLKAQLDEMAKLRIVAGRTIIDTSFQMRIGETVVVGTSKLSGESALIVLLTAVGK